MCVSFALDYDLEGSEINAKTPERPGVPPPDPIQKDVRLSARSQGVSQISGILEFVADEDLGPKFPMFSFLYTLVRRLCRIIRL